MTYLWSHHPFVSSPPKEVVHHVLHEGKKGEVDEIAVFKLENDKFLFIRFYGLKENINLGHTVIEEFDKVENAVMLYEEIVHEQ